MQKYKIVEDFLEDLDTDKLSQVNLLRNLIKGTNFQITEHIKWNAPSYIFEGEDRLTFNIMNKQAVVKLVFHMGPIRKEDKNALPIMNDESGLIKWSSNIRGTITFQTIDDINSNLDTLQKVINQWLATPTSL